ncbi:MAG: hypothetical protein K1Y36_30080 [Blastocatellia bacterium]|nr:hypothetical protein [Blastocatellia bacterium]
MPHRKKECMPGMSLFFSQGQFESRRGSLKEAQKRLARLEVESAIDEFLEIMDEDETPTTHKKALKYIQQQLGLGQGYLLWTLKGGYPKSLGIEKAESYFTKAKTTAEAFASQDDVTAATNWLHLLEAQKPRT